MVFSPEVSSRETNSSEQIILENGSGLQGGNICIRVSIDALEDVGMRGSL